MSVKFCHSVVASSVPIVCSIFQKVCAKNANFYQSGKTKCPLLVPLPLLDPATAVGIHSWTYFVLKSESNMDRFSCLIAFKSSFSSSSGFNGTPRRRQSWRPRCRRLRTPSQRPSSSYHNWTESTHGGTHRLVGLVLCLCATEFGNDG